MRCLALTMALWGCGANEEPGDFTGPAACGERGEAAGTGCAGLEDCGEQNAQAVAFCENCPLRAVEAFCVAGRCDSARFDGAIDIGVLALPPEASGARSVVVAALEPVTASGVRLTCEGLLSPGCPGTGDSSWNASNVRFVNLSAPVEAGGSVYGGVGTVSAPGAGKLLFVRAATEVQGRGTVVAEGCAEGIEVPPSGRARVEALELAPSPQRGGEG